MKHRDDDPLRDQVHRRPQHAGGLLGEPGQRHLKRQVRLRHRGGRRAALCRDVWRQPEPDDPRHGPLRDPERLQEHQVRGGAHLGKAAGGGAVHRHHGCVRGRLAARLGGPGRGRRAVRRLRVLREAGEDVVQVGGPAADERRRQALRPAVPVRVRPHHGGEEVIGVEIIEMRGIFDWGVRDEILIHDMSLWLIC